MPEMREARISETFTEKASDARGMTQDDGVFWTTTQEETGPFFNVVHTTKKAQVTMMTVEPGKVAGGPNTHEASDQVSLILEGEATVRAWEDGPQGEPTEKVCPEGTLLHLPAGTQHWVKSTGQEPLVFFTVYAPPEY